MDETWDGHVERAHAKLKGHDERILVEVAVTFYSKVGSSSELLRNEFVHANWARRGIDNDDCEVIWGVLRSLPTCCLLLAACC